MRRIDLPFFQETAELIMVRRKFETIELALTLLCRKALRD